MLRYCWLLAVALACTLPAGAAAVTPPLDGSPVPVVGVMSDQDYARLDAAPLHEFDYKLLDRFLRERVARGARLAPLGEEVAYWALKQRGTGLGINIADFKGVTGQYLAMKATALAYARNVDEFFAILSLIQFADGRISWTYHNRDIGGQLIENNGWIWHNVTQDLLVGLGPEHEGVVWTILYPRERQQRAMDKGERCNVLHGSLGAIRETEAYRTAFIAAGAGKVGRIFPEHLLQPGDILVGVRRLDLTEDASRFVATSHGGLDAMEFGLAHQVGVIVQDGDGLKIATLYGSSVNLGSVGQFVSMGKDSRTVGAIVLRPTVDVVVVLQKASEYLLRLGVVPDWNWLDSRDGVNEVVSNSRVYTPNGHGGHTKSKGTLDLTLRQLWFFLDTAKLGAHAKLYGVAFGHEARPVGGQ